MAALFPAPAPYRPRRRLRWALLGLAALFLLAASAAAGWWWGGSRPPDAAGLQTDRPVLYLLQRASLEVVDPADGDVLGRQDLPGGQARWSALTPDRRHLFLLDATALYAYATDGYNLLARVPLGEWTRRVAVGTDGTTVAVTMADRSDVLLFRWDGESLQQTGTLATGGEPGALLFHPDGGLLYVGLEDALLALNTADGTERFRVTLPKPHQKDPVRKLVADTRGTLYAYYINAEHLGAVAVIDAAGTLTRVHEFGRVVHDIALAPDEQTLYVTWRTPVGELPRRGGLLAFDPATFRPIRPEIALQWAMGVAPSPDGQYLYVTESRRPFKWDLEFPGRLVRIHVPSWQVLERKPVGRLPTVAVVNY